MSDPPAGRQPDSRRNSTSSGGRAVGGRRCESFSRSLFRSRDFTTARGPPRPSHQRGVRVIMIFSFLSIPHYFITHMYASLIVSFVMRSITFFTTIHDFKITPSHDIHNFPPQRQIVQSGHRRNYCSIFQSRQLQAVISHQ